MAAVLRDRSGFTLIELVVALVISGLVAGVVYQFLLAQGRFARYVSAREEVQQNARAALEVITSDLRGLAPGGILAASENAITFRSPRAWGVVCGRTAGGLVVLFAEAPPAYRSGTDSLAVPLQSGGWGFRGFSETIAGSVGPAVTACNEEGRPLPALDASVAADTARVRLFTGDDVPPVDELPLGSPVYFYEIVRYEVHTYPPAARPSGRWIRRSTGTTAGGTPTMQPLAGPLPDAALLPGLRFEYRDGDGSALTQVATDAAQRDAVSSIRVLVRTQSTGRLSGTPQQTAVSTVVYLRNRN